MMNLSSLTPLYPDQEQRFKRNILREYLQYKILESIFELKPASKLAFLGGTTLRIIHESRRFSEDLDFDNFGLTKNDFQEIVNGVVKRLTREGYTVETKLVFKGAYRCYVRIPGLLFSEGLSPLEDEKLVIQINTMPHGFQYPPENMILNKFDVFTQIAVTPLSVLLSQKIGAILNRKSAKGRDFYDFVFLLSKTIPDYGYLVQKLKIRDASSLREALTERCKKLNFKKLTEDVQAFLIDPQDAKKITLFPEYLKQAKLG